MGSFLSQKLFWHTRWIVTILGMFHCIYFLFISTNYSLEKFCGLTFLLLFLCMLLYQLEKYVECLSNCPIPQGKKEKK